MKKCCIKIYVCRAVDEQGRTEQMRLGCIDRSLRIWKSRSLSLVKSWAQSQRGRH